jgi:arylformamidase
MQIYDVTLTISADLPVWPGDPDIQLYRISKMEEGAHANVSQMNMGVHVGTHVDAPYHFLGNGAATVESLSLNLLTGRAYVLQIPHSEGLITAATLVKAEIPPRTRRLLFKTRNSTYWASGERQFQTGFVGLSPDAAEYVVNKGIKLVGIDYLSIAPYKQGAPTHKALLEAGVVVIEGLDLSAVRPGRYSLYCLPLKLAGSDGAPARAILVGV